MNNIMNELTGNDLTKYLSLYNSDIDWSPHLQELARQISRRVRDPEDAKEARWQQVACTILLPTIDKSALSDPPENLLFKCHTYHQFKSKDWKSDLIKVVQKDEIIKSNRDKALQLGVIYPIEYYPNTRQALRWLVEHSQSSGDWVEGETEKKLQNLVLAYGGAVICNVFMKPEYKTKIHKILNWRTGYFFERLIYEVYKPEDILKIKKQEILKVKNSDPKLVKLIRPKDDSVESNND